MLESESDTCSAAGVLVPEPAYLTAVRVHGACTAGFLTGRSPPRASLLTAPPLPVLLSLSLPRAQPHSDCPSPAQPCSHPQFFLMTRTSPHSSSDGRKISGTTMRILRLGGGLMFQTHSTPAG